MLYNIGDVVKRMDILEKLMTLEGVNSMKLTFIGAAHEVTGSCHCLQICGKNILIDCGMEQGEDAYENAELPISEAQVDYVLLTHAHIDHSGLLPMLYRNGFRGQIYATEASTDLCDIMLRDSAHIQQFEAEWHNRKARRAGAEEIEPIYTMEDAEHVIEHFVPCAYNEVVELCENVRIRFSDVGHLLGSASIEIWFEENGIKRKIVFSGDIGNINQPIIKDPQYIKEADIVVMESTYGDRSHGPRIDYVERLTGILQSTFDAGGNVVIPSFAVGRTQEMLYFLRKIKEDNLIKGHENFEVYVDSPLAVEATNIFNKNTNSCFDEEAMELVRKGINPISFPGLKLSLTSDESKAINFDLKPKVILSASGMCEAGRIRHHLKHNLWRKECTILFVGYQAAGTLGRTLLEGASSVKLFGELIDVKANIQKLDGVSGHADKEGLIKWVSSFDPKPEKVYVVHGEDKVCEIFAEYLRKELELDAVAPYTGAVYELESNKMIRQGDTNRIRPKKAMEKRASAVFARLVAAGQRLMYLISKSDNLANKDIAKFADQVNSLCDKWEDE